jgi:hypothetical protein
VTRIVDDMMGPMRRARAGKSAIPIAGQRVLSAGDKVPSEGAAVLEGGKIPVEDPAILAEGDAVPAEGAVVLEKSGTVEGDALAPSVKVVRDLFVKVAVLVFTTLGLAGTVGLVGSVLLWERFDQAGLPAEDAVGTVPADQRILEGATGLIALLIIGLLGVLFVYAFDPRASMAWPAYVGTGVLVAVGVVYVWGFSIDLEGWGAALPARLVVGFVLALVVRWIVRKLDEIERRPLRRPAQLAVCLIGLSALPLILGFDIAIALESPQIDDAWRIGLTILAVASASAALGIAFVTGKRFVPFAAAVFVSVILFGTGLNFAIAEKQVFAQPVAVLKDNGGRGICGLYVSDTDDEIFVGLVGSDATLNESVENHHIALYGVDRGEDTRFALGDRQPWPEAVAAAPALLERIKPPLDKRTPDSNKPTALCTAVPAE